MTNSMNTEGHLLKIKQHVEHEWNAACAADAGTTVSVKKTAVHTQVNGE